VHNHNKYIIINYIFPVTGRLLRRGDISVTIAPPFSCPASGAHFTCSIPHRSIVACTMASTLASASVHSVLLAAPTGVLRT